MARITIEDCLENVPNRFALVLLAADRAKDLIKKTAEPLIEDYRENKEVVTALREIADGIVQIKQHVVETNQVPEGQFESLANEEDAASLSGLDEVNDLVDPFEEAEF
jgi:DNA-directed RNA polymerase subunit omega